MRLALITPFAICLALAARGEEVRLPGLGQPVEILRDKWGVPHIYAKTQDDLFFAQGYVAARDRLFQIDLWRRVGTGKLAEVLGGQAVARDRLARLVRFRGDWNEEWQSYSPDARQIASAFVAGINAYIHALGGKRPIEFRLAGYDPGLWQTEDVVARIAGLLMVRNLSREVQRAELIREAGMEAMLRLMPPDPMVKITVPRELDLADITQAILRDYTEAIGAVRFPGEAQGSNNWVVDGTLSVTGKPILANDPHRPILLPSLRKTVHLVGPGWNVYGAGEPSLPGIALGHNEEIAFGFTIVGMDQADLYVEKLHPTDDNQYEYRGAWQQMEVVHEQLAVKASAPQTVELKYTRHGPVLYEDRARRRAYALKWVGSLPGSAGYFAALSLGRARNWQEFLKAVALYKVPSENMVYADRAGNIGWIASGLMPVRRNWTGLLPVPGHTGEHEWAGYLTVDQLPQKFNPASHFAHTANHNILPPAYPHTLSFEWAAPFRADRIGEMMAGRGKFSIADFQRMQQDVTSLAARRFLAALRNSQLQGSGESSEALRKLAAWDGRMDTASAPAAIYAMWMNKLSGQLRPARSPVTPDTMAVLMMRETGSGKEALEATLEAALAELRKTLGSDPSRWRWGQLHQVHFRHPLGKKEWSRGPYERPGDANTVNAAGGTGFTQNSGASYRQIIDLSDWDRSVMTNVPGESGNPESPYYDNLIDGWLAGRYHPMLFSRKAVEEAAAERITLTPAR